MVLVLGYALFQRYRLLQSPETSAEDGLAILCGAYDNARAHAEVETLEQVSRDLHRAADSVCTAFSTHARRRPEQKGR